MPVFLDKVKPLRLVKTPFFTPVNKDNKRFGSAIFLFSPNRNSSINLMKPDFPMIKNLNMFNSLYIEKNVVRYIDNNAKEEVLEESYKPELFGNQFILNENFYEDNEVFVPFNESVTQKVANTRLRRVLFNHRIRTTKELKSEYDEYKAAIPTIKNTYYELDKYKNRNIYVDFSLWIDKFITNNSWNGDYAIDLLYELLSRFINDSRYNSYTTKTILIPVEDWIKNIPKEKIFDHKYKVTPISMIYRLIKRPKDNLSKLYGYDFVFITDSGYFKVDLKDIDNKTISRFAINIRSLISKEIEDEVLEDKESVKTVVLADLEKKTGLEFNNISGITGNKDLTKVVTIAKTEDDIDKVDNIEKSEIDKAVASSVDNAIERSQDKTSTKEVEDNLEQDEWFKKTLLLAAEEREEGIKISATRKARLDELDNKFLKSTLKNTKIEDLLKIKETPITPISLDNVESPDDEWKYLKRPNFEKSYDLDADIVKCIKSLSDDNKYIKMSVLDIDAKDISTGEDSITLYTVHLEDSLGKRHTLKFDVPKIINNRFLRLRGNDKVISGQLVNLPILKTDATTAQIVSNYNKIFITRQGQGTKLNSYTDAFIRAAFKYRDSNYKAIGEAADNKLIPEEVTNKITKIELGNNTKICAKYVLPAEYIELAKLFNKIITKNSTIYFNQDELRNKLIEKKIKLASTGLPFGITNDDKVLYHNTGDGNFSLSLRSVIDDHVFNELMDKYNKPGRRLAYSQASILSTKIPLIIVMAYSVGLTKALNKSSINYEITETRPKGHPFFIKFEDGYLDYSNNYNTMEEVELLLHGLDSFPTEDYSIMNIDSKTMWLDALDMYGGRNKADGLDSFYNLMMDPLTIEVCNTYKLPTDYIEALAYASSLLTTNKFNRHVDITGNRFRTNERLAHFVYKSIATSYGIYLREVKNNRKDAKMSMKQSAVVDLCLADATTSDLSKLNPLLEAESANAVTFKGLSGMNSDRSYGLDKRTYDKSMVNKLALSTGFAANVGINRQTTINMDIQTTKGYINSDNNYIDKMNDVNTLSMSEALTPFGTTRDDPFRSAMTFVQTAKHSMRTKHSDPLLVTNGADQALPYLTSDTFAHKAKEDGKIKEISDNYIIIEYKSGKCEYIDIRERIEKNSDGGFFITIKLDPIKDFKVGQSVKDGEIIAYDKGSYSDTVGSGNLAYNIGTLTKIAIIHTDEGFEDSAVISKSLSDKMESEIVLKVDVLLNKDDIILNMLKKGSPVQEGQALMTYQASFEDKDANQVIDNIIKSIGKDADFANDLGKINIKSKATGILQDIKVYRTLETTELSPSLKKIVDDYERPLDRDKKTMNKYGIYNKSYDSTGVLQATGKLKHSEDKVLVEFYIKYFDKMSVGDKLVYFSALKGTVKTIFPEGKEPYSEYRPNETIHSLLPIHGVDNRIVSSILIQGAINKVIIELDRHVKDIMGIKWDDNL